MSMTIALTRGNVLFASSTLKYLRFASTGLGGAIIVSLYKSDETPGDGSGTNHGLAGRQPADRHETGPESDRRAPSPAGAVAHPPPPVHPLFRGRSKHPSLYHEIIGRPAPPARASARPAS